MGSTASDLMTPGVSFAREGETLVEVAQRMRDLGVGALPICNADQQLTGMITDRDITVHCVAAAADPATTRVESLANGAPVTIRADDSVEDAIRAMTDHKVRRLPVVDGTDVVGMLTQADIARGANDAQTAHLVAGVSLAPPNN